MYYLNLEDLFLDFVGPYFKLIMVGMCATWLLFGLGFDTASEVITRLFLQAHHSKPFHLSDLMLPILFASVMSLLDTLDEYLY